jgi:hypothetical protein
VCYKPGQIYSFAPVKRHRTSYFSAFADLMQHAAKRLHICHRKVIDRRLLVGVGRIKQPIKPTWTIGLHGVANSRQSPSVFKTSSG